MASQQIGRRSAVPTPLTHASHLTMHPLIRTPFTHNPCILSHYTNPHLNTHVTLSLHSPGTLFSLTAPVMHHTLHPHMHSFPSHKFIITHAHAAYTNTQRTTYACTHSNSLHSPAALSLTHHNPHSCSTHSSHKLTGCTLTTSQSLTALTHTLPSHASHITHPRVH